MLLLWEEALFYRWGFESGGHTKNQSKLQTSKDVQEHPLTRPCDWNGVLFDHPVKELSNVNTVSFLWSLHHLQEDEDHVSQGNRYEIEYWHVWLRGHWYTSSLVCFIGAYWNALGHDGHVVSKADLRGWSFSFTEATNGCCRGGVLHVTLALMLSHFAPEVVAVCTKWPLQHRHLCLSKRWEVTMKSAWQTKVDLVGTFGLKKTVHKTRGTVGHPRSSQLRSFLLKTVDGMNID